MNKKQLLENLIRRMVNKEKKILTENSIRIPSGTNPPIILKKKSTYIILEQEDRDNEKTDTIVISKDQIQRLIDELSNF